MIYAYDKLMAALWVTIAMLPWGTVTYWHSAADAVAWGVAVFFALSALGRNTPPPACP